MDLKAFCFKYKRVITNVVFRLCQKLQNIFYYTEIGKYKMTPAPCLPLQSLRHHQWPHQSQSTKVTVTLTKLNLFFVGWPQLVCTTQSSQPRGRGDVTPGEPRGLFLMCSPPSGQASRRRMTMCCSPWLPHPVPTPRWTGPR